MPINRQLIKQIVEYSYNEIQLLKLTELYTLKMG